jgi:dCMP deaminase
MKVAGIYGALSSARRAKVGCVIVKDNRIISIGYNGMPSGWDNNCEDEDWPQWARNRGWKEIDPVYVRLKTKPEVLHAETNAIAKVARSSENCDGATLYTTMLPCLDCAKLIYQSGIQKVFYAETYPKGTAGLEFLNQCKIPVVKI